MLPPIDDIEVDRECTHNRDEKNMGAETVIRGHQIHPIKFSPDRHPDRRLILWSLFPADNITARHATESIARSDRSRGGSPLPLAHHIVGLKRVESSPVGNIRSGGQESPDVAYSDLF